jgi:hypothetical protein
MATNQDRDSLHHPTGTLVPLEDNDEFIAKVTEKVAERVREIILDDDPFRPVDLELLAIRVAQIISNRDNQNWENRLVERLSGRPGGRFERLLQAVLVRL